MRSSSVGPCGSSNAKIVLINVVWNAIIYYQVIFEHVLKKFPRPSTGILGIEKSCVRQVISGSVLSGLGCADFYNTC